MLAQKISIFDYKINIVSYATLHRDARKLEHGRIKSWHFVFSHFESRKNFYNSEVNPEHFQMCAGYKTTKLTSYKFLILTMCCIWYYDVIQNRIIRVSYQTLLLTCCLYHSIFWTTFFNLPSCHFVGFISNFFIIFFSFYLIVTVCYQTPILRVCIIFYCLFLLPILVPFCRNLALILQ